MIILLGCEDKTFTHVYDKQVVGKKISSIAVSESNISIKNMAIKALKSQGFDVKVGSIYVIEIEGSRYPKKCNNPNTSTYDATYDGFIKLTLLKQMKPLYMCQQDYHGRLNTNIIADLVEKMKEELKLP
jgi:hypothetical protein